jgi:hypothetical protein
MLTAKQEKFCQNLVSGMSQYEAYVDSHPDIDTSKREWIDVEANREVNIPKISLRLQELKDMIVDKLVYTVADSFNKLVELQDRSLEHMEDSQGNVIVRPSVQNALKAEELKGKLCGLYIDKKDLTSSDGSLQPNIVINTQLKKQGE